MIGNGLEQSKIDDAQINLNYARSEEETLLAQSLLDTLLDSLDIIGENSADSSNRENPILLNQGVFYNINVLCKPPKAYHEKFTFNFRLLYDERDDNETTGEERVYSKVIATARTKEINSSEEFTLNVNTLIPTDIKTGRYLLVVNIVDKELDTPLNEQNISKISQMGALYIKVEESSQSQRIDLTAVEGSKYIDLPYIPSFVNGYSNIDAQKSSLIIYSSSFKEENVTISALLKLENGDEVSLGLLDTDDGVIKNEINYSIPSYNENDTHTVNIDVSFYIPENQYTSILKLIPDLSEDKIKEAEAKIVWRIKSKNNTIITNNLETTMFLSKFIDDFDSTENNGKNKITKDSKKKALEKFSLYSPDTQYVIFNKYSDYSREGWKDATTIKNLTFKTIDATLDYSYDIAFLFNGDKYVEYNKNNHSVSEVKKISDYWKGIPFNSIDAAFKVLPDDIYLFSGDQYLRVHSSGKIDSGYPKKINDNWHGLDKLKNIDAVVNYYYDNKIYFFGKNSDGESSYLRYDWHKDRVDGGYPKKVTRYTWSALGETDIAGCFYDQYPKITCFKNKTVNSEAENLINSGIFFKYDGEYNKILGRKNHIALAVDSKYSALGRWDVPGINGKVKVDTLLYLYNKDFSILDIDAEATIALDARYTREGLTTSNRSSRTGSSLKVSILNAQIYDSYRIKEKNIEVQLTQENSYTLVNNKKAITQKGRAFFNMPRYMWNEKKVLYHQVFAIGPVPLDIEMGIEGKMELNIGLGLEGVGVKLTASAPIHLLMYLNGGINLAIIRAGVGGEGEIINTKGDVSVRSGLTLTNRGDLAFDLDAKAKLNLNILRGSIYLYASKRSIEYCQNCKWGVCGPPWPCGFDWDDYKYYIYRSRWAYQRNWTLIDKNFTLYTIKLAD